MRVAILVLSGKLEWLISRDDPATIESGDGWGVINPFVPEYIVDPQHTIIPFEPDHTILKTSYICLAVPEKTTSEEIINFYPSFLQHLRVNTRQPEAPIDLMAIDIKDIDAISSPKFTHAHIDQRFRWLKNTVGTAASIQTVAMALGMRNAPPPPVYAILILDAIAASHTDPRQTILYCAFAIEILAASTIEDAFKVILDSNSTDNRFRVIETASPPGGTSPSDPVFRQLMEAARRQYRVYLHQLPLYVMGRSLLLDDEILYQQALSLQQTRNAIAHHGEPDETKNNLLGLDREGASDALTIARGVFKWFGAEDYFIFLDKP